MEITNETKAKVFAQYLGNKCYRGGTPDETLTGITDEGFYFADGDLHPFKNPIKLMLKPLSAIRDEDAIEVAKLQQEFKNQKGIKVGFHIDDKNNGCLDCIIEWGGYKHDYWQPVYSPTFQYLQNKGYDLPNYLLGGKTLQKAGLAIYE